jgi:hypothetical protein
MQRVKQIIGCINLVQEAQGIFIGIGEFCVHNVNPLG